MSATSKVARPWCKVKGNCFENLKSNILVIQLEGITDRRLLLVSLENHCLKKTVGF